MYTNTGGYKCFDWFCVVLMQSSTAQLHIIARLGLQCKQIHAIGV